MERTTLVHKPETSDEQLANEAHEFYAADPARQAVAEAYIKLIEQDPAWFAAEAQIDAFPLAERLQVLASRADERAKVFNGFAGGLPPKTVRNMVPDMQAQIMGLVLANGEKTLLDLVRLFDPKLLVCYADAERMWRDLVSRIPWHDDSVPVKDFILHVSTSLLRATRHIKDGKTHPPIMTYHEFRTAIDFEAWQKFIPLKARAEADKVRLGAEAVDKTFKAEDEIKTIGLELVCREMPTQFFHPVFRCATGNMSFDALFMKRHEDADKPPSSQAKDVEAKDAELSPKA